MLEKLAASLCWKIWLSLCQKAHHPTQPQSREMGSLPYC
jgi:hypothetical protein